MKTCSDDNIDRVNELTLSAPAEKKWVALLTKYINITEEPSTHHFTADQMINRAWARTGKHLSKAMSDYGEAESSANSPKKNSLHSNA